MKKLTFTTILLIIIWDINAQSLDINLRTINPAGWPFVWDIAYDVDSTIWAVGEVGSLYYKNKTSDKFAKFITPVIGSSDLRAISVLSPNDIWISVDNHGLFHYNGTVWNKFDKSVGLPILSDWRSIQRDAKGNIWFGNYGNGVARFDGSTWRFYNENNSGLKSNYVIDLIVTEDDKIWAGASEDLMIFSGNTWTSRDLDSEFGFRTWINNFYKDDKGQIWIATENGVLVQKNGVLLSQKAELGERNYQAMAIDKNGVIWLVETFEGLWRYNNNGGIKFTQADNSKVPTQGWKILISSQNEKLIIGNQGSNLIEVNDDAFTSSTSMISDQPSFYLFPNPASDVLYINADRDIIHYKIFDLNGKLYQENSFYEHNGAIEIILENKLFDSKMYLLQLITKEGQVLSQKVYIH